MFLNIPSHHEWGLIVYRIIVCFLIVSDETWHVMTSSPREKDAWIDALKKVLGERFVENLQIAGEVKKVASNLERSDSKRSEVKSAPILDAPADNSAFTRSFSVGPTFTKQGVNRSAGSSPIPEKEIQQKVFLTRCLSMCCCFIHFNWAIQFDRRC